jgi:CDP-glycerol glycerophosphotransferase (TagB/SpsB family)
LVGEWLPINFKPVSYIVEAEQNLQSFRDGSVKQILDKQFLLQLHEDVNLSRRDAIDTLSIHLIRDAAKKIKKINRITFIGTGNIHENTVAVYKTLQHYLIGQEQPTIELLYLAATDEEENHLKNLSLLVERWNYQPELSVRIMESKVIVFNSHLFSQPGDCLVNAFCSAALKVQLWHGVPAKSIGFNSIKVYDNIHFTSALVEDTLSFDIVTVPSEDGRVINEYAKGFPNAKIMITGDPRLDILFDPSEHPMSEQFKLFLDTVAEKKKIFIATTFYDQFEEHQKMIHKLKNLVRMLVENDVAVVINFHPTGLHLYPHIHEENYFRSLSENLYLLSNKSENTYSYFRYFDALITDWSSIRFDFLAVDKPILLWREVENFRAKINDVYEAIDEKCHVIDMLDAKCIDKINDYIKDDPDGEDRRALKNRYYFFQDSNSSFRVTKMLEKLVVES